MENPPRLSTLLAVWFGISVLAGLGATFVPWGDKDGFHGSGFPVPSVVWEKDPETGRSIDFPNPTAILWNPVLIFGFGSLVLIGGRSIWNAIRGSRSSAGARSDDRVPPVG